MPNEHEMGNSEREPEKTPEAPKQQERTKMEDLTVEQRAQYRAYMRENPEPAVSESKRESGPEILEFEVMVASYGLEESVEELMQIDTMEDALKNPLRQKAKAALGPVLKKLQAIKKDTEISGGRLEDLELMYKRFSSAVGMINSGEILHEVIE